MNHATCKKNSGRPEKVGRNLFFCSLHGGVKRVPLRWLQCSSRAIFLYSRSPKNPAHVLQLQKSSKAASTTPQRPISNSFATVAVRDFWETGCTTVQCVLVIRESLRKECGSRVFHSSPCGPLFFILSRISCRLQRAGRSIR